MSGCSILFTFSFATGVRFVLCGGFELLLSFLGFTARSPGAFRRRRIFVHLILGSKFHGLTGQTRFGFKTHTISGRCFDEKVESSGNREPSFHLSSKIPYGQLAYNLFPIDLGDVDPVLLGRLLHGVFWVEFKHGFRWFLLLVL